MNTKTLGRFFSAFSVGLALLGGASISRAAPPVSSPVIELGNNTYSITCEANNKFTRKTEPLKAQATEDAAKFCASRGKQLKVVSTKEHKWYSLKGNVRVTIIFKAVDAGDLEQTGEQTGTGDLYSALIKLDDLRKKGILTEEEFQAEKKKVLNRSK